VSRLGKRRSSEAPGGEGLQHGERERERERDRGGGQVKVAFMRDTKKMLAVAQNLENIAYSTCHFVHRRRPNLVK